MRFWILGFGLTGGSLAGLTEHAAAAFPGLLLAVGVTAAYAARRRSA